MRIGLCLASTDHVWAWFSYDLAKMLVRSVKEMPDLEIRQYQATGCWLPELRELTTQAALNEHCDYLLYLDSDMRFPATTLVEMLARNVPIVAANYTQRKQPYWPVAVPNLHKAQERLFTEAESTGLIRVEAVGMGVMLIKAEVVARVPTPRFGNRIPEDLYFCMQLDKLGETIRIDQDLSQNVRHIGVVELEASHAVSFREPKLVTP